MRYAKPIRASRRMQKQMTAAARVAGCTCKRPDHVLTAWHSDKLQHANTYHDDGCPAIEFGRIAVVLPPRDGSRS
jgi:hypothetical protein